MFIINSHNTSHIAMRYFYALVYVLFFGTNLVAQQTILWKVEHPNTEKTSYLLGTFHQMGNSFVDSIPIIEALLVASDIAVFESIDSKEALIKQMNARPCTNVIADVLNDKELEKLKELTKTWKVELCKLSLAEIYVKLRQEIPKHICNTVQAGDTWDHFDNYLMSIAKANHKEMKGLETTNFQLNMINELNNTEDKKANRKKIKNVIKQISKGKVDDDLCAFANNYRNFKLNYLLERECSEGVLFKERNKSWMKQLPNLLKRNNCFVAVGYGHLMMDCGLIASLRDNGFVVEPIIIDK